MKPNTTFRTLLALGVASGILASAPAYADDDDEGLRAVPPASTSLDIPRVYQMVPSSWGMIKRTEDLLGETRRDATNEAERFTLKGDVFFDVDKATLTSDAEEKLEDIAEELGEVDIEQIEVGGHTDTVDSHAHNDKLSEERAESVASFLRDRLDDVDITATGYGKRQLAAPEEGSDDEIDEARSRNRRVEIDVKYLDEGTQTDGDTGLG